MRGMNARTGAAIEGEDHLRQSVGDILSTPIGSRVARRDYGSLLPDMVDQPANATGRLRIFAATALAILRWEPRISLTAVSLQQTGPAAFAITLDGRRTDVPGPNLRTRLTLPLNLSGRLPVTS